MTGTGTRGVYARLALAVAFIGALLSLPVPGAHERLLVRTDRAVSSAAVQVSHAGAGALHAGRGVLKRLNTGIDDATPAAALPVALIVATFVAVTRREQRRPGLVAAVSARAPPCTDSHSVLSG